MRGFERHLRGAWSGLVAVQVLALAWAAAEWLVDGTVGLLEVGWAVTSSASGWLLLHPDSRDRVTPCPRLPVSAPAGPAG